LQTPAGDSTLACPVRGPVGFPAAGGPPSGAYEENKVASAPAEPPDQVRQYVAGLSSEERMLVLLKGELYEGNWDEMVADLRARLEGRPYIFKLAHRISDDLERIERLRRFEARWGVNLSDYVRLD
jgi:hypothetical protein